MLFWIRCNWIRGVGLLIFLCVFFCKSFVCSLVENLSTFIFETSKMIWKANVAAEVQVFCMVSGT